MRCEVLQTQDLGPDTAQQNTDIEIWREATAYHTALTPATPRDLARVSLRGGVFHRVETAPTAPPPHHCPRTDAPSSSSSSSSASAESDNNTADTCDNNLVDSAVPPKHQRLSELQKLKANCKPEELQKLKTRCEVSIELLNYERCHHDWRKRNYGFTFISQYYQSYEYGSDTMSILLILDTKRRRNFYLYFCKQLKTYHI